MNASPEVATHDLTEASATGSRSKMAAASSDVAAAQAPPLGQDAGDDHRFQAEEDTPPLLLIEDTPSLISLYRGILTKAGWTVDEAPTLAAARTAHARGVAQGHQRRIVLLDLMLPDGDGLDLLGDIRAADPGGKVIVITSNASINRAVDAMRQGAFDYLVKPFDDRKLLATVRNARTAQKKDGAPLRALPDDAEGFHDFIGGSAQMRGIYDLIRDIGRSTATVFLTGESGTGKEVAAQTIHAESARSDGPFIPLNCGAIPADLLESEVFGHLKGSFTGAIADKPGAAAAADGGTLFLDEICEMDLALQTKLLRFLQTSTVTPVGATTPRKVDVRIICATNRDPAEEVRAGRFREDLFYRLHVVPAHLPPLRERGEDVISIAHSFLRRFCREENKRFVRFSDEVAAAFRAARWPGNVRQLQNVVWNTVLLHDGEEVTIDMLPQGVGGIDPSHENAAVRADPNAPAASGARGVVDRSTAVEALIGSSMAMVERDFIEATIAAHGGSVPQAARVLDLSPSTIYRKREAWAKLED